MIVGRLKIIRRITSIRQLIPTHSLFVRLPEFIGPPLCTCVVAGDLIASGIAGSAHATQPDAPVPATHSIAVVVLTVAELLLGAVTSAASATVAKAGAGDLLVIQSLAVQAVAVVIGRMFRCPFLFHPRIPPMRELIIKYHKCQACGLFPALFLFVSNRWQRSYFCIRWPSNCFLRNLVIRRSIKRQNKTPRPMTRCFIFFGGGI